jgi:hypothetical protein
MGYYFTARGIHRAGLLFILQFKPCIMKRSAIFLLVGL